MILHIENNSVFSATILRSMSSVSKKRKVYQFHPEWEHEFFVTQRNGTCVCLLCQATIAFVKKTNIERHFRTVHPKVNTEFPLHNELRKEKIKKLITQLSVQQNMFTKPVDKSVAATLASYRISNVLAKRRKPFEDGEFIKEAFREAADELFHNFKNKSEIVAAIESLQLSSRTVTRRVESMSEDVFSQLKKDLDECRYFSMQMDESVDATGIAQLPVFVRMVFSNFTVKEELLKVIPLKGHTRGEDIFFAMKQLILSEKIPLQKLVSITTDGAPALRGSKNGFLALCQRDESFPQFLTYHCILHQQSLCGKFLNLNETMKTVVKIVNKIRSHSLQRRLFKELADELELQYGDLLLHTEVRWLSKGKVLQRVHKLLPAVKLFLQEIEESSLSAYLEDPLWLRNFAFLVDLTEKLNELNVTFQGKDKDIAEMISEVNSFIEKLSLWESCLQRGELRHFPTLKTQVEKFATPYNSTCYVNMISTLRDDFSDRFSDFKKISVITQFVSFPWANLELLNVSSAIENVFDVDRAALEVEIISLKNDLYIRSVAEPKNCWPLIPHEKYPVLVDVALRIKSLFASTYLCESLFSNMNFIKNKHRTRLTDEHLDSCIRLSVTSYTPNIKDIVNQISAQVSH